MTRRTARVRVIAVSGAVLLASSMLSACGNDGSSSAPLSANAQWADGVCGAYAELESAVAALDDGVPPVEGTPSERVAEARDVIATRISAVRSAAGSLREAVKDVPPNSEVSLADTRSAVTNSLDGIQDDLSSAQKAIDDAVENPTPKAIPPVVAAASQLSTAATSSASEIRSAAQDAADAAKQAFQDAPTCQPYLKS